MQDIIRKLSLFACFVVVALFASMPALARVEASPSYADRVIVVFHAATLPPDAASRVQEAGGEVVRTMPEIGVLLAKPVSADSETFLRNLRRDEAIFGADFDIVVSLVEPAEVAPEEEETGRKGPKGPKSKEQKAQGHLPHPFPFSPTLPPDWFYTDTAQQWSVKRVGAQGGSVAGGDSGAWDTTSGNGGRIAILDTGVSSIHPDIAPNLVFNFSFATTPLTPSRPSCDDGSPEDQVGHGSWTASIAAGAEGAGTGLVVGVAPRAQILNIKVLRREPATGSLPPDVEDTPFNRCLLGNGSGLFSWTLNAILLSTQLGADVVNMSLGGFVPRNFPGGGDAALWAAFNRVTNFATSNGVVLVGSAGNSALDLDALFSFIHLPSASPNVITVMATTNPALLAPTPPRRQPCAEGEDCLAFYSNFGSSQHGLSAPGGDLPAGDAPGPTGFVRGACSPGIPETTTGLPPDGSFGCFSFDAATNHRWYVQAIGTSAAAPHVAGAAALLKAADPGLSPAQIRTILQQTAEDIGEEGYDELFNFGLVDAAAGVAATQ